MKISETIITTQSLDGEVHITPFGIRQLDEIVVIAPFRPSKTLDNILTTKSAVVNFTDDVRVFAGALTNKLQCEVVPVEGVVGVRLAQTLAHQALRLVKVDEDEQRPTLYFEVLAHINHRPFSGFNRAQAAVVELAVLVSRLNFLPKEKIMQEKAYLQIAIDKTAGEVELEAWGWLDERVTNFYAEQTGHNQV